MIINVVEVWHYLLKTYTGSKEVMETFFFSGVICHILNIGNYWEQRALEAKELWFKTQVVKCTEYFQLA